MGKKERPSPKGRSFYEMMSICRDINMWIEVKLATDWVEVKVATDSVE
ncbi:MAG: hypothetical protein K2J63_01285 [Muribaculaceae bacterium]|nr:hypothetical protein [Muribaculaceae bacterium]